MVLKTYVGGRRISSFSTDKDVCSVLRGKLAVRCVGFGALTVLFGAIGAFTVLFGGVGTFTVLFGGVGTFTGRGGRVHLCSWGRSNIILHILRWRVCT